MYIAQSRAQSSLKQWIIVHFAFRSTIIYFKNEYSFAMSVRDYRGKKSSVRRYRLAREKETPFDHTPGFIFDSRWSKFRYRLDRRRRMRNFGIIRHSIHGKFTSASRFYYRPKHWDPSRSFIVNNEFNLSVTNTPIWSSHFNQSCFYLNKRT